MANGLRLVPVEAEVASGNRQIRRHGQFFAPAREQQSAVVADAQAKGALLAADGGTGCLRANLGEQGEFASSASGIGMGLLRPHIKRI